MVNRKENMVSEIKKNMRGGDGEVTLLHLVPEESLLHSRLMSKITIPVGAGIGEHEHLKETEYYIILKGKAIVNDNGKESEVNSGDVVITGHGSKHSIKNIGNEAVEMIAIIILE